MGTCLFLCRGLRLLINACLFLSRETSSVPSFGRHTLELDKIPGAPHNLSGRVKKQNSRAGTVALPPAGKVGKGDRSHLHIQRVLVARFDYYNARIQIEASPGSSRNTANSTSLSILHAVGLHPDIVLALP